MLDVLEPTQDPGWGLSHEGYNVLSESPRRRWSSSSRLCVCVPPSVSVWLLPSGPGAFDPSRSLAY
jgi:hypothetical protein